jgi:hypothetical protein
MAEYSPFLHRTPEREYVEIDEREQTYAQRIIPSPEEQRALIEHYRYNWYARTGSLTQHFMQRLGDFGRKYCPFIGYGWNGFGSLKR